MWFDSRPKHSKSLLEEILRGIFCLVSHLGTSALFLYSKYLKIDLPISTDLTMFGYSPASDNAKPITTDHFTKSVPTTYSVFSLKITTFVNYPGTFET